MSGHLEGTRSRHRRAGRISEPDRIPFRSAEGVDDWLLKGGCAGCGFSIFGWVRESFLLACPSCARALCIPCYAGPGAQAFPTHRTLVEREYQGPHGELAVSVKSKLDPARPVCRDCAERGSAASSAS